MQQYAESSFNNFQIRNGNDIFRFVEIEFYLRTTKSESRKIAYERETRAGEWFLHDNGVSQGTSSYMVEGLGNPDSFQSWSDYDQDWFISRYYNNFLAITAQASASARA